MGYGCAPSGVEGKAPWSGDQGAKPTEAENILSVRPIYLAESENLDLVRDFLIPYYFMHTAHCIVDKRRRLIAERVWSLHCCQNKCMRYQNAEVIMQNDASMESTCRGPNRPIRSVCLVSSFSWLTINSERLPNLG